MMRSIPVIILLIAGSCNSGSNEKSAAGSAPDTLSSSEAVPPVSADCYWRTEDRDTLVALINLEGNNISGKMSFDNYQIDGSSGSIKGGQHGDTLKLWYAFESEGTSSVMEIWLLQQGNELVRGEGPSNIKGDTVYFTNPAAVRFPGKQILKKVDCGTVPGKYK